MKRNLYVRKGALVLVLALGFLTLGVVPAAAANSTVKKNIAFAGDFVFGCDGFDVRWSWDGFIIVSIATSGSGTRSFEIDVFNLPITFENLATGAELTAISYGPNFLDFQDGTLAIVGVNVIVTQPGQGAILLDVGIIVIDLSTFTRIAVIGPHEASLTNLCALLA